MTVCGVLAVNLDLGDPRATRDIEIASDVLTVLLGTICAEAPAARRRPLPCLELERDRLHMSVPRLRPP